MKKNSTLVLHHIVWRGLYFFSILLLNIGIARYFAAEKSGQIFFIVNNLALILLFASISLESGATYYISSGNLDASKMARFCLIWVTVSSMIAFLVWYLVIYYSHPVYLTHYGFLLASFLFIIGILLTTYFTSLFYAQKNFGTPNKILLLVNFILFLTLVFGRNNPIIKTHFLQIYFFCYFLQGLVVMLAFFNRESFTDGSVFPPKPILKKVIQYSLTALIANLIYFLVNRIDYWFVQYYCSSKDLGNYIQASKLGQMLFILPAILGSTLFPIFSSQKRAGNPVELTIVIRILFGINLLACTLILGTGWYFIPHVFGRSFNNMYLLFVLLIPGILCVTMNYPLASWFSASRRIAINIKGSLLALAIICIGDFVALPRFGVLSASIVSSAGYFTYCCYTIYIYRKENNIPLQDFLFFRKSDVKRIRQSIGANIQEPPAENYIV
jgi:O-antigen/teichoic acid export membrane protein